MYAIISRFLICAETGLILMNSIGKFILPITKFLFFSPKFFYIYC